MYGNTCTGGEFLGGGGLSPPPPPPPPQLFANSNSLTVTISEVHVDIYLVT